MCKGGIVVNQALRKPGASRAARSLQLSSNRVLRPKPSLSGACLCDGEPGSGPVAVELGVSMFLLRSAFWLGLAVLALPPAEDGAPAPRVTLFETAHAVRTLLHDVTGLCGREPEACATSRDALGLLAAKLETGAGLASRALGEDEPVDHGTLTEADLAIAFAGPASL